MESRGKLYSITKDWETGKFKVTFELDSDVSQQINGITDKELTITAKQYRKKRSLDSNAYYWQLLSKLAEYFNITKARAHNLMLRRYGQTEIVDGSVVYIPLPDTHTAEETALEAETFHISPTSQTFYGTDGVDYRTYRMLRGSSTYNSQEMAMLVNGLVDECKSAGIETLPPEELERMANLYAQRREKNG